jgi:hypothetical protein
MTAILIYHIVMIWLDIGLSLFAVALVTAPKELP